MRQTIEALLGLVLASVLFVGLFVGGILLIVRFAMPAPHVPFNGVRLPADTYVVTSRSWFQPSLFSLETYAKFQQRPVELKWLYQAADNIRLERQSPSLGHGPVLVLIHGYNAPENKVGGYFSGILGMLRQSVGPEGVLVVYDWPSTARHWEELSGKERRAWHDPGGGPVGFRNPWASFGAESLGYRSDQAAALHHGAAGLVELLNVLSADAPRAVTILAHSMGALVTMEALRRLPQNSQTLGKIVLLAPDLPADALVRPDNAHAWMRVEAVYVMHSRRDEALWYSQVANREKRLGRDGHIGDRVPPPHITVKDVTDQLGDEGIGVHGRYLELEGATAVDLAMVLSKRRR